MGLLLARLRHCKPCSLFVLALAVACLCTGLRAEVCEVTLKNLSSGSDLIVVARVSKVEDGPANLKSPDPFIPAPEVATAQVIETWKGAPVREVRYIASPTWKCDTSSAEVGERVVLFLEARKDSTIMSIAHAGRGRMPLREVGTRTYAALDSQVILPRGTPTISEKKTASWPLWRSKPGKPARTYTFTYSVDSIELGVLSTLVRARPLQ